MYRYNNALQKNKKTNKQKKPNNNNEKQNNNNNKEKQKSLKKTIKINKKRKQWLSQLMVPMISLILSMVLQWDAL